MNGTKATGPSWVIEATGGADVVFGMIRNLAAAETNGAMSVAHAIVPPGTFRAPRTSIRGRPRHFTTRRRKAEADTMVQDANDRGSPP